MNLDTQYMQMQWNQINSNLIKQPSDIGRMKGGKESERRFMPR